MPLKDDTLQFVLPAISAGYSVKNDEYGRLKFWNETVEIVYRDCQWVAKDGIDKDRQYSNIRWALEQEA